MSEAAVIMNYIKLSAYESASGILLFALVLLGTSPHGINIATHVSETWYNPLHHMLQTTCKHVSVVLLLCTFSLD
jgi:hypothetical protein